MKKLFFSIVAVFAMATLSAQEVALKWNPVALPIGGLNVAAEMSLGYKWSLLADAQVTLFNPLGSGEGATYTNGWIAGLEGRFYFNEAFDGHHLGLYATVGRYGDYSISEHYYYNLMGGGIMLTEATNVIMGMAGLMYGYYMPLDNGWGVDVYVGLGVAMAKYTNNAGVREKTDLKFNVQKLGIAMSYKF